MTIVADQAVEVDPSVSEARRASRVALFGWLAVVAVGGVWGQLAIAGDRRQSLRAAPLFGRWVWHAGWPLVPAVVFGLVVALIGPRVLSVVRWRYVPLLAGAGASAWTALLAVSDGWSRLGASLTTRHEYVPFAATIDRPADFVRSFTERAGEYPVHVKGHPPGATLVFWLLDAVGFGGGQSAAGLVILAWGVGVAAVVIAVAEIAGRQAARQAAPFIALVPAVVWAGTSADALFAGVAAVGASLLMVASGRSSRRAIVLAVPGGVVLAAALHLTYGVVPLLLVPAVVVLWRRRLDVIVTAVAGAVVVTALWLAAGFWWFDGLATTRTEYWAGVGGRRSWPYFLLAGNPAALALAVGPAVAVAVGWARRAVPAGWLLAAAAFVAVAVADVSALSKGEVERIWLPYVPWLATVTVLLPVSKRRAALLGQVGVAVVLQAWLRSPW